ncbi:hypothetical protein N7481_003017 [Penicillium waksmanii]|uniref:uncharacterized protein n=1 Tax=Penicillium waksmanii TaxID=69791 RepID=UPI002546B052|nr:uncharacterized protein N7481_003017 [Penicillium waksmanii]KAJ5987807.1 hypothetical protein N7481_003017 [Penicillium waksmanii]
MDTASLSSNWKKLQATLKKGSASTSAPASKSASKRKVSDRESGHGTVKKTKFTQKDQSKSRDSKPLLKRKRMADGAETDSSSTTLRRKSSTATLSKTPTETLRSKENEGLSATAEIGKYVAMDCEMVGVGPHPDNDSVLARVSIVNFNGDQIYDSYVRPKEMVTDWRTHVSGIMPKHMVEARTLETVQKEVYGIMEGRVLVGHAVSNDLDALMFAHPKRDIRDTSKHAEYRKIAGGGSPPTEDSCGALPWVEDSGRGAF